MARLTILPAKTVCKIDTVTINIAKIIISLFASRVVSSLLILTLEHEYGRKAVERLLIT